MPLNLVHRCGPALLAAGLLCGGLPAASAAEARWPELLEPPRAKVEWVAQDVRVNGLRSRILRFDSELPVQEILAFYQRRWGGVKSDGVRPIHMAGWEGWSSLVGEHQFTVQVRAAQPQGSSGFLSVANVVDLRPSPLPRDWPTFSDTRVLQVTESEDGPQHGVLVHGSSQASFMLNVDRWRREWLRRGFSLTREVTGGGAGQDKQWMAFFDKAGEQADITIAEQARGGQTLVTVNHVQTRSRP